MKVEIEKLKKLFLENNIKEYTLKFTLNKEGESGIKKILDKKNKVTKNYYFFFKKSLKI